MHLCAFLVAKFLAVNTLTKNKVVYYVNIANVGPLL